MVPTRYSLLELIIPISYPRYGHVFAVYPNPDGLGLTTEASHIAYVIVVRVQPSTSKGITDLLSALTSTHLRVMHSSFEK